MDYYRDEHLVIRDFTADDIDAIVKGEQEQGWWVTPETFLERISDRDEGKCIALAAEYDGEPVGYVNLYPDAKWGAFGGQGLPEIVDLAVLEKCRRKGIANRLLDTAETLAKNYADKVYLGVGLHSGYGSAQRIYIKRGYLPDGSGVWYNGEVCPQYENCCNDDDLILYLSKDLR